MATIERIDVWPIRLPMTASFSFASGSAGKAGEGAPHVFVKITDSDGAAGWGEGRPVVGWSYETLETITTTLRRYVAPALVGLDISDRHGLHAAMARVIGRGPAMGQPIARAAVDIALHDLLAKRAGLTLRSFLGGADGRRDVALSYTVTGHTADDARRQVEAAAAAGFSHFNFKAAVSPESDQLVARALRQTAGPGAFVWADANQGYALHAARRAARVLEDEGVDVLEQPLPADQFQQMRQLRQNATIPLAVDEASVGPTEFFHHAAAGLVDYLVVKLTRSGGIWPSLQQIAIAEAAGLKLLLSGLTDGLLVKLAACQLASVFGYDGPAALNGSQFTDELALFPDKPSIEHGGSVHLPDAPGLGAAPDEAALARFLVD